MQAFQPVAKSPHLASRCGLQAAVTALIIAAVLAAASSSTAEPGLVVGVTDDAFLARSTDALSVERDLGLQAFRVALPWAAGQTAMQPEDVSRFDQLVPAASGLRIVVTVYGRARSTPTDEAGRSQYCAYVADLLTRYPTINDIVIWNEPNLSFFWQPQFDSSGQSAAPGAYEALLARCWDVLHAVRPSVNVIMGTSPGGNDNPLAVSNVSHSPPAFIRKIGDAYRASGRAKRIFDTVGHNPYGENSAEDPWRRHLGPWHIAEGDVDRLVEALNDGFRGTAQPIPSACGSPCVSIWYLEAGYQTVPDPAHQAVYMGSENDGQPIPDAGPQTPNQATQLANGIELAYCQPYVTAFFNFLLWDEPDLARWQSGVFWTDGGRKASYDALRRVVADVKGRRPNCAALAASRGVSTQAGGDAILERVEWPSMTTFSAFNVVWRFEVEARTNSSYSATVYRAGRPTRLQVAGSLKAGQPRVVQFPLRPLPAGTYRIGIVVTRSGRPTTTVRHTSPTFVVM
jgi:hypothetical protein